MNLDVIEINALKLGGTPVFKGTRVPIETLFDHLESGISMEDFIKDFPSVSKDQVVAVLAIAAKLLSSKDIKKLYETTA